MKKVVQETADIVICPRAIAQVLFLGGLTVVTIGGLSHVLRHLIISDIDGSLSHFLRRFDLVEEPSMAQWFASSLHLFASLLTVASALTYGREMKFRWLGLAVIFCFASVDEAVMLHEMMDRPMRILFDTSGYLSIAWIIPGSLLAIVIAATYIGFLRALPRTTAKRFFAAGVLFLSGAILMELPGGYLFEKYGFESWHYIASYCIEEILEISGMVMFIYGLLCFLMADASVSGQSCSARQVSFVLSAKGPVQC